MKETVTTLRQYAKYQHVPAMLRPELENAANTLEELSLKLDVAQHALQSVAYEAHRQDQPWIEATAREALERIK